MSNIKKQLEEKIKQAILRVDLLEGDPIPSVRKMAMDCKISPQTILKATLILINDGILKKQRGKGLFVKEGALEVLMRREFQSFTSREIPSIIDRAKTLDINKKELLEIIRNEY